MRRINLKLCVWEMLQLRHLSPLNYRLSWQVNRRSIGLIHFLKHLRNFYVSLKSIIWSRLIDQSDDSFWYFPMSCSAITNSFFFASTRINRNGLQWSLGVKPSCIMTYFLLTWPVTLITSLLILYTLASVGIFSKLYPVHFLRCWQGEVV